MQKGFSLKISKDGTEKLNVTEVIQCLKTRPCIILTSLWYLIMSLEYCLLRKNILIFLAQYGMQYDCGLFNPSCGKVEVETVDEDCSKFLVWEFGCQYKVSNSQIWQ